MALLEDRIEQLEGALTELKADIKILLVDLKILAIRDHNPLENLSEELGPPTYDSRVIALAPSTGV